MWLWLCISQTCGVVWRGAKPPPRVFVFGLGYVGRAVAESLVKGGWAVSGTCTSELKASELRTMGINAFVFDDEEQGKSVSEVSEAIKSSTHILSTVPPTRVFSTAIPPYGGSLYEQSGDAVLHFYGEDILRAKPEWVGYLSSTGVYGDREGGWVTELDPPKPDKPKSIARSAAEDCWRRLHSQSGLPVHSFRLAGIYGPRRSALDTLVKAGGNYWACAPDDIQFISRIHVADICRVLQASMEQPQPGLVLNVADDLPATRSQVLSFTCGLLGISVGAAAEATEGAGNSVGVRGGSKRVDNSQMQELLRRAGQSLAFPTYREGIESLIPKTKTKDSQ